jgi:hypothetical protein
VNALKEALGIISIPLAWVSLVFSVGLGLAMNQPALGCVCGFSPSRLLLSLVPSEQMLLWSHPKF